jgi:hypothetical protein
MAAHEGGDFGSGDTGTGGSFNQIHRKPNNTCRATQSHGLPPTVIIRSEPSQKWKNGIAVK